MTALEQSAAEWKHSQCNWKKTELILVSHNVINYWHSLAG